VKGAEVEIHDPHGRATRSVLRHELGRAQDRLERLDPHDMRDPGKDQLRDKRIRALANAATHLHEAKGYVWLAHLPMAIREAAWGLAWLEIGYACACGDESKRIADEVPLAIEFLQGQIAEACLDIPPQAPAFSVVQAEEEDPETVRQRIGKLVEALTSPLQGKRLTQPPNPASVQRSRPANPAAWNEPQEAEESA
jgi:hypothetical protein